MTTWQQSFESQQLIAKVSGAIESLQGVDAEGFDEGSLANYSRLLKTLGFIRGRLKSIDPELISQTQITNLGSWITNLSTYVQNFVTTKSAGHLQNANSTVDSILDVVRGFRVTPKADEQAIGAAATQFRDKAINEIERVRESRKEAITELATIKREITQSKVALEQLNEVIERQKGRLDESIAEFQKQFSQSEAMRLQEFQTALTKVSDETAARLAEFERAVANERKEYSGQFDKLRQQLSARNDEQFSLLQQRHKQIDEIFGAIGSASFAGHFRTTADQQKKNADWLRMLALGLMGAMVVVGAITFYHTVKYPQIDWRLFLIRLATTLVLAIPALYAAKESAKHRERERQLRRSQLELASIDAYLALLPKEKRNEIKERLTEKFFGREEPLLKEEPVSGSDLFHLVELLIKKIVDSK